MFDDKITRIIGQPTPGRAQVTQAHEKVARQVVALLQRLPEVQGVTGSITIKIAGQTKRLPINL